MKLTDGKRTVEIIMMEWDGNRWGLDWSLYFFVAGKLLMIKPVFTLWKMFITALNKQWIGNTIEAIT